MLPAHAPAPRVVIVNAFDAFAGSQRVTAMLAAVLRARGHRVLVRLGFGRAGFVSGIPGVRRFLPTERVAARKRLYPLWLAIANLRTIAALVRGDIVWVCTIYALPAVLPMLLAPRRLVIHIHETDFPGIFGALLGLAARRGAAVVAVSRTHAALLGLPARVLGNAVGDTPPTGPTQRDRLIFVGTSRALKGFDLFVAIVEVLGPTRLTPVAYLGDPVAGRDPALLARSAAAGITLIYGETDPARLFADGWLTLQLTDPALWTETFSLVAAESIWHLVPVGAAGAMVVEEIGAGAIAFNDTSRDPVRIAAHVRTLLADAAAHARLVAGCAARRDDFRIDRFGAGAEAILADCHA